MIQDSNRGERGGRPKRGRLSERDQDLYASALVRYYFEIKQDPGNPVHWLLLGHIRRFLGLLEDAREAFQEVVALAPEHSVAWDELAELYGEEGQKVKAWQAVESAAHGRNAEHAGMLVRLQRTEEALRRYLNLVEQVPESGQLWMELAQLHRASGREQDAAQALHNAVAFDADFGPGWAELARFWARREQTQKEDHARRRARWLGARVEECEISAEERWELCARMADARAGESAADPVQQVLPGPFAWCTIPAVRGWQMMSRSGELVGTFDIRAFDLARFPVTNAQFQVFLDHPEGYCASRWWEGTEQPRAPRPARFYSLDHPRTATSWYEAVAFCRWLSAQLGYVVRLPSEWEWQWAAQGPEGLSYPWGERLDVTRCNSFQTGIRQPTVVDLFPQGQSSFGVMDLLGNVLEWCGGEVRLPFRGEADGRERRSVRGGSWAQHEQLIHSAMRGGLDPGVAWQHVGFRIARSAPREEQR